ncbi:hypothetical protein E2C01_010876 [Portunus trituberculatus]|uniref:Uncharacterized protein n=1 Tax=Portunus trituberculatus TaxID=210409 RepID=A0A5B7DA08_PORTR|nr:hypothetical protein [Portunus trituberculatus]
MTNIYHLLERSTEPHRNESMPQTMSPRQCWPPVETGTSGAEHLCYRQLGSMYCHNTSGIPELSQQFI